MQIFDGTIILLTLLAGVSSLYPPLSRYAKSLTVALVVCTLLHLTLEGWRWQMVPTYLVLAAGLLVATTRTRIQPRTGRLHSLLRWGGAAGGSILVLISVGLSYAFPVFEIQTPRGKFAVGTLELHLEDKTRAESYTPDTSDHRELMVRVWYPAASTNNDRASYWQHTIDRSTAVTRSTPLPWFTFTHLNRVTANSFWHAPHAKPQNPFPVILYSHGLGIGWASANTKLMEGLASRGYVVVGINHAYLGSISIFPDGRMPTFDSATSQAMNQPPPSAVSELQTKLTESSNWQEHVDLYSQAMALMPEALTMVTKALETQVADQRFVIGELGRLQKTESLSLTSIMDLQSVGVLGMSLGGSAALLTCAADDRCKAGVNLDGFHPAHLGLKLEATPFLYLSRADNLLFNSNFLAATAPTYSAVIPGATHFNFFDFSIMSPLYKRLGVLGPIDGNRMLNILEDYSAGFFDEHLGDANSRNGKDFDGASIAKQYPETTFSERNTR